MRILLWVILPAIVVIASVYGWARLSHVDPLATPVAVSANGSSTESAPTPDVLKPVQHDLTPLSQPNFEKSGQTEDECYEHYLTLVEPQMDPVLDELVRNGAMCVGSSLGCVMVGTVESGETLMLKAYRGREEIATIAIRAALYDSLVQGCDVNRIKVKADGKCGPTTAEYILEARAFEEVAFDDQNVCPPPEDVDG